MEEEDGWEVEGPNWDVCRTLLAITNEWKGNDDDRAKIDAIIEFTKGLLDDGRKRNQFLLLGIVIKCGNNFLVFY
jgi:hypothetical protein